MGALLNRSTRVVQALRSVCVVGRLPLPQCALALDHKYVSNVHAEIRWTGQAWELRDLRSRNGTIVDGQRLPGVAHRLAKGARIAFGSLEEEWELIDDAPPVPMVVPLPDGAPVLFDDGMIAIPSKEDPQVTVYRSADCTWIVERPDDVALAVVDGQTFHAIGREWLFCSPELRTETVALEDEDTPDGRYVSNLHLTFQVSRNEEYVHLEVAHGRRSFDLGARQHHFILLTLARRRLEDAAHGGSGEACGWLDQEEVEHDPSMNGNRLNLAVHRIRKQFGELGVIDFGNIVQRRVGQLRVGTPNITIARE
ncbi:MAG: FHA domain-containing protein [Polyangiaceae bacterium]|jgi:hypothetical protein